MKFDVSGNDLLSVEEFALAIQWWLRPRRPSGGVEMASNSGGQVSGFGSLNQQ